MLHNIQRQCPEFGPIAIKMYRNASRLFVCGAEIASSESTTQGDNLAMPLFALATLPVLQHLEHYTLAYQVWLADDVAAVGTLEWLKPWWDMIVQEGIKYGYHVNDKSCLVLKHLSDLVQVLAQGHSDVSIQDRKLFGSSGIKNSCDGKRYLGSNRFNGIYRSIH